LIKHQVSRSSLHYLAYLSNLAVDLILPPAADYFLQVLQQVAVEMVAEMVAKMEMVQETHQQLQAVVGKG
jgi:D-ribose pyranose/furanose isomerase RbsD